MTGTEDTPYIEPPERLDDDPEKNGLNCFLDEMRVCGTDCMAYTTFESESPHLNHQQKHCVLIVGAERLGRYSGALFSLLKKGAADNKRTSRGVYEIPDPKGG